jgi:hypothetical protein
VSDTIPDMNIRNASCLVLMIAFVSGLGSALRALSNVMSFPGFTLFGVVTIAVMAALGFAWDHFERTRG